MLNSFSKISRSKSNQLSAMKFEVMKIIIMITNYSHRYKLYRTTRQFAYFLFSTF